MWPARIREKPRGWPIHYDPDDVTRAYFRDPETRKWHTLMWEHAPSMEMPLSQDALQFARKLAASKYTYPDDRLAVTDLLSGGTSGWAPRWRNGGWRCGCPAKTH